MSGSNMGIYFQKYVWCLSSRESLRLVVAAAYLLNSIWLRLDSADLWRFSMVKCFLIGHISIFFALCFPHNHCALSCLKRHPYNNCTSKGTDLHMPICSSYLRLATVVNSFSGGVFLFIMCQEVFSPNAYINSVMPLHYCLRGAEESLIPESSQFVSGWPPIVVTVPCYLP